MAGSYIARMGVVFACLASFLSSNVSVGAVPISIQRVNAVGQKPEPQPAISGPQSLSCPLPAVGRALDLTVRMGRPKAECELKLSGTQGASCSLDLAATDEAFLNVGMSFADKSPYYRMPYYLKPNPRYYVGEKRRDGFPFKLADPTAFTEQAQVMARYAEFPSALTAPITVRLERTEEALAVWLDGRFLAALPADMKSAELALSQGNEFLGATDTPALRSGFYQPLDLSYYTRPGAVRFAPKVSGFTPETLTDLGRIPFLPLRADRDIDVGLSRWLEEKIDPSDFCDTETTRSAFDGCPESIILQVPKENYVAAHVLCVVEPSDTKVPALTLRVTRFGNHYGDSGGRPDPAMPYTTVYLPADPAAALPPGILKVGEVTAAERSLPVYLVTVPLKMGEITDLLGEEAPTFGDRGRRYFDIELTKEMRTAVHFFNLQSCRIRPIGPASAVHVLGMTLERSPVDVAVTSSQPGNIFYAAENPVLAVKLTNTRPESQKVTLGWEITDYYGATTRGNKNVTLPAHADKDAVEVPLPLTQPKFGYFDLVITVKDAPTGRELWRQPTSFALLPPDTRQVGNESPFGCWWFQKGHGCCAELAKVGPILQRMGMRHTCPQLDSPYQEKDLAAYKVSYSMANWYGLDETTLPAFLDKNPHIRLGMIFHEIGIPDTKVPFPELLGQPKPDLSKEGKLEFDKRWKQMEVRGDFYRSKYPNVTISFGNSPSDISVQFMRYGLPRKYVDCFGMEGVGVWFPTEGQPRRGGMQEVWWLAEMQRLYGYTDIPLSSGYEYICRCTQPGGLTERQQADLYVRDSLHCLAYGYQSINIGLLDDCPDSYSTTIYGASGFVRRTPLLTPKVSYVAYATLTQALDSAKYARYLETGSRSLYVLEFTRGGEHVYPIWTARGRREVALKLQARADATLTDGMGNSRKISGDVLNLTATPSPMYLTVSTAVASVTPGRSAFDETEPAKAAPVSDISDPEALEMETAPDHYLETYAEDIPHALGKFSVAGVQDEEKGKCIELTLAPQPETPKIVMRYVGLKLKNPVKVPAEVGKLGLWVKGNSCWGRVYFEFADAHGEKYFSACNETSGWDVSDWMGKSAINFDGWCFVSLDLPKRYPGGFHGPRDRDWSYSGGDGDGVVQFPITVTRFVVGMRDWQVYVKDMVPSKGGTIRLKGLVAGM